MNDFLKKDLEEKNGIISLPIKDEKTKKVTQFYKVTPFPNYKENDDKQSILKKGNKNILAQQFKKFIEHIPTDFNTYLEPFIGGGAVYFHLNPEKAVINDVHKELVDFYQSIKDGKSEEIYNYMNELNAIKNMAQPTKIKTSGSTFKNPIDQTDKKVWELIRLSVPTETQYGDAVISEKHANFFVNKKNAKSGDMKSLINFVKKKVKDKTGVKLELEIVVVE